MKCTVRTPDGELTFDSFGEVEKAWLNGLVGPEDEIRREGETNWRKAKSFSVLATARRSEDQIWQGTQTLWVLVVIVLASAALYLLAKGYRVGYFWVGIIPAFAVCFILVHVSVRAYKRRKPY